MFNKSGIVSQRQLPLRELTQFTEKKEGDLDSYESETITLVAPPTGTYINATATTIQYPTGITANDFAVISYTIDNTTLNGIQVTIDEGFTKYFQYHETGGLDRDVAVFYKKLVGDETGDITITWSGATRKNSASIHVWRGVDETQPFDSTYKLTTEINTIRSTNPPISTYTVGALLLLLTWHTEDLITAVGLPITPTGLTLGFNIFGLSYDDAQQSTAYKIIEESGFILPSNWTNTPTGSTTTESTTATLALRPVTTKGRLGVSKIYQDTGGTNIQDSYFYPDNIKNTKLRTIQPARGYNFTGVESITFPVTITTIVDQDGDDLSGFLTGLVLTPSAQTITNIIINSTDIYNLDESSGLTSFDASGNGNNGAIELSGSTEASFHVTDSSGLVPSIQNEIGYNTNIQTILDYFTYWNVSNVPNGWSDNGTHDATNYVKENANGMQFVSDGTNISIVQQSLTSGLVYEFTVDIYSMTGDGIQISHTGGAKVGETMTAAGIWTFTFNSTGTQIAIKRDGTVDCVVRSIDVKVVNLIPINQAIPTEDVIGNVLPPNQTGQVRYEEQIKASSVGNFDGVLVLTFSDLSGRTIVEQQGTVTVQISGNTIQPVSGTGELYYLEFDNGSKYYFSETNGLVAHDLVNSLNGSWTLGGSGDGTQWSTSDVQYPKNLVEGFNKAGYMNGVRYGLIGGSFALPDHWEFIIGFTPTEDSPSDLDSPFGQTGAGHAFKVEYRTISSRYNFRISAVSTLTLSFGFEGYHVNEYTELRVTVIDDVVKTYANGVMEVDQAITVDSITMDALYVGVEENSPSTRKLEGNYSKVILNELNSGGTLVANLIELDWANGDDAIVANIAVDAPTGTSMSWLGDNGDYVRIPADPSNPTLDINGNPLTIIGYGKIRNSAENLTDRNPMDAPELVANGIIQGEDRSYDVVTADITSFYDNHDDNKIQTILVYSDFVEPMAGSAAYFDANLYADWGSVPSFEVQDFEIFQKIKLDSISGNLRMFAVAFTATSSNRGGVLLLHRSGSGFELITTDTSTTIIQNNTGFIATVGVEYSIRFKKYGTTLDWTVNDSSGTFSLSSSTVRYSTATPLAETTIGFIRDGTHSPSLTDIMNGTFSKLEYYELNSGGTRVNELSNMPFEEENGLVWYNTAADRPTGNTNADVIRGGSSDGTQFTTGGGQHNLQYGATRAGYFADTRYLVLPDTVSDFRVNDWEIEFNIVDYLIEAGDQMICEIEGGFLSSAWRGIQIKQLTSSASIRFGCYGTFGNIASAMVNGGNYKVNVTKIDDTLTLYIDDISKGTLTNANYVTGNWDTTGHNSIGISQWNGSYPSTIFNRSLSSFKYFQLSGSTTRLDELINADFNTGNEVLVPNIGANAPIDTQGEWTLDTGEYVEIPGDPSNYGFDVNGTAISNPDEVKKYRKINRYLRK